LTFAFKICGWTGSECQIHSTSSPAEGRQTSGMIVGC
jgi:hypothetical protein